jgi:hypothetical protein
VKVLAEALDLQLAGEADCVRRKAFNLKLCALLLFLPAGMLARPSAWQSSFGLLNDQSQGEAMRLNTKGRRGVVYFNHQAHEEVKPDTGSPHQADSKATCAGCHHSRNAVGVPQLWKCAACHRSEGHARNPQSRNYDEVYTERAFHLNCIGCHRASSKGPIACGDCHQNAKRD